MANTRLTRTTGAGNRQKWTWSGWIKRTKISYGDSYLMGVYVHAADHFRFYFPSSDQLHVKFYNNTSYELLTNRRFRDMNAWYHIVLRVDTTHGTAANRFRLYVNGVQETSFATENQPTQNLNMSVNDSNLMELGSYNNGSFFDGCMSHVHFLDGEDRDSSYFGETDSTTGIWKPKTSVTGVNYGTNGFFLKFENSGVMGTDSAGSNNYTVSGTMTQLIDTPSNVFATFNPLNKVYMNSISNNNNTIGAGNNGTDYSYIAATIGASSGKYYWEAKVTDLAEIDQVGVALASSNFSNVFSSGGLQATTFGGKGCQFSNGYKVGDGSGSAYMGGFSANDIMMIALDLDNNKITFGRNGQWADGSGNANQTYANSTAAYTNLTAGETYIPAHAMRASGGNTGSTSYNFGNGYFGTTAVTSAQNPDDGNGIFEYDVPAGFRALCTKSINAEEYS